MPEDVSITSLMTEKQLLANILTILEKIYSKIEKIEETETKIYGLLFFKK